MKRLLPLLFLVACNSRQPVHMVGKNGMVMDIGATQNFAAQGYMSAGFDKNGNPRLTVRDNSEAVPMHALDVAGVAYGTTVWGAVEKAADAGATAVATGAQKQASKQAAIAAGVEVERIKAGTDALRITTPPLLPK